MNHLTPPTPSRHRPARPLPNREDEWPDLTGSTHAERVAALSWALRQVRPGTPTHDALFDSYVLLNWLEGRQGAGV